MEKREGGPCSPVGALDPHTQPAIPPFQTQQCVSALSWGLGTQRTRQRRGGSRESRSLIRACLLPWKALRSCLGAGSFQGGGRTEWYPETDFPWRAEALGSPTWGARGGWPRRRCRGHDEGDRESHTQVGGCGAGSRTRRSYNHSSPCGLGRGLSEGGPLEPVTVRAESLSPSNLCPHLPTQGQGESGPRDSGTAA